jgi:UPF0755 protein
MRRSFGIVLLLLGFVVGIAGLEIKFQYDRFNHIPLDIDPEGLHLVIPKGGTMRSVAAELQRRGVLAYPSYLVLLARWQGVAQAIKAGEYYIPPGTTPPVLLRQIVAGKVMESSLTLVEGWTFSQVMAAVGNSPYLQPTLTGLKASEIMERLGHPEQHPEGRFFPDTYHFPVGTTDLTFLQRAYRLMEKHMAQEWDNRAPELPYQTSYEALILASIIERESALPQERPLIAGVFVRRLQKGMRLQTDPTVIYGLGKDFNGALRRLDLQRDTPYNTYTRSGFPPSPICMPSLESLRAALHPAEGRALYFVARGDGSHHFSATLEEHQAAVQAYQRGGAKK